MSVISDIAGKGSLTRTVDGYQVERVYIVDDVQGTPETRLYNAMATSGVPQYGDPHPILPDVLVTNINARLVSSKTPNQVSVNVSYSIPDSEDTPADEGELASGVPVISAALTSEDTGFDINGEFLKVSFTTRFSGGGFTRTNRYEQVSVQRPQMRVTLTRTEPEIPKTRIAEFLGTINSQPWSGFPEQTWLCSSIDVDQEKTGFEVKYSFVYRPGTWKAVITIGIPENVIDDFPPDVTSGNGFGIFDVYPVKDFNTLGLSF